MNPLAQLIQVERWFEVPGGGPPVNVLRGVDLEVRENEHIAITGPSGSGKSTLLNILGTLDRPDTGRVLLQEREVKGMSPDELAKIRNLFIGFVFQQHFLLPQLTLLENILLPVLPSKNIACRKQARELASALAEKVGLEMHLSKFPAQMSVGECQRAAVVRALINRPGLLLADEPTGSLDRENADHLAEVLRDLRKEHQFSMVIVTHSEALAASMDRVYSLTSGKLRQR